MASNLTADDVSVTSGLIVTGDNPIHHALLLLIAQVAIIIGLSRFLGLLLRPLKQPRVVAEILGGILLGPTAFGYIPNFTNTIFPPSSLTVLETIAEFGLIFFLFLVGLELNITRIRKSGVMTAWMAAAGIILPFGLGTVVSYIICKILLPELNQNFGTFTIFLGVALSITAFPVLARILAERKLLNTEIGQMAMSAAAINDVVSWILLALAVAVTNSKSSPLVVLWVALLGIAFLAFMVLVVSPITYALAHYRELPPEPVVAMTLLLVLGAAFLADIIGIHVIFGAFICGLVVPKDGPFAAILIEKVEDYVNILFLPLYFASSGLKTHLSAIRNGTAVLILIMVLATACLGKVLGTFIVAKLWGVENRKAAALGFLMNTKGLVELIVLNIGLSKGVVNEELFAILVIMALVTTFMTTPVVMWIYSPARDIPPYVRRSIDAGDDKDELRMLLCPVGSWNIPSMINMIEITRGKDFKSLRAYVLHLIECSDRLSSIRMSASFSKRETFGKTDITQMKSSLTVAPRLALERKQRVVADYSQTWRLNLKKAHPAVVYVGSSELDAVEAAFQTYSQVSRVRVKTAVAISAFHNMHIDICNTSCANRVNFLLLPFHMRQRSDGSFETVLSGLKEVNRKVLQNPPCSVGLLLDNGLGSTSVSPSTNCSQQIYVLFFGGSDDREALMLARRMLQHGSITLTVIQFVIQGLGNHQVLGNIRNISSPLFISHSQTQSVVKRVWSGFTWLAREVLSFFKAPWINTQGSVRRKRDSGGYFSNVQMDASKTQSAKDARIFIDKIESQSERHLDMQALAPILEAAKEMEDDDDLKSNGEHKVSCRKLTLKVIETLNLEDSVLDVFHSAQPNDLIISGLHLNPASPVKQSCAFPAVEDHGLGPLGDFLVSKKHFHMHASLLLVKQHSFDNHLNSRSANALDPHRNLHPVVEKIVLGSSASSVDASTPSANRDGDHSDCAYSRATRSSVTRALHDLGDSLSSP